MSSAKKPTMLDQATVFFRSRKACGPQFACQKSIFYHDCLKYSASHRRVKVSDRWANNVMFTKPALLDTAQNITITFPDSGGPSKLLVITNFLVWWLTAELAGNTTLTTVFL